MDYYKQLGVSYDATSDAISRAFKKMAVKYHPDKTKDPADHQRFLEVNEAYETLKTAETRRQYDRKIGVLIRTSRGAMRSLGVRGGTGSGASSMPLAGAGKDARGSGKSSTANGAKSTANGAKPPPGSTPKFKSLPQYKEAMDSMAREYMEKIRREAEEEWARVQEIERDVERQRAKAKAAARDAAREFERQRARAAARDAAREAAKETASSDATNSRQEQKQYRGLWAEARRYDSDIFSVSSGQRQNGDKHGGNKQNGNKPSGHHPTEPIVVEEDAEAEPAAPRPAPPPVQKPAPPVQKPTPRPTQKSVPQPAPAPATAPPRTKPVVVEIPDPDVEVISETTARATPRGLAPKQTLKEGISLDGLSEMLGPDPEDLSSLRDSLPEMEPMARGNGGGGGGSGGSVKSGGGKSGGNSSTTPRKVLRPRSRIAEFLDGKSRASTLHTPVNTYGDPRARSGATLAMEDFHALATVLEILPPPVVPEVTQSAAAFAQYQLAFESYREKIIQYQMERAIKDRELRGIYGEDYREFAVYLRCLARDLEVMGRYFKAVGEYEAVMRLVVGVGQYK